MTNPLSALGLSMQLVPPPVQAALDYLRYTWHVEIGCHASDGEFRERGGRSLSVQEGMVRAAALDLLKRYFQMVTWERDEGGGSNEEEGPSVPDGVDA